MNLAEFDQACARLAATALTLQWGGAHVWKVGAKMFAVSGIGQNRHAIFACSIKASEMAREALRGVPGIRPAPYLARAGWLEIEHGAMPDAELADMIRVSHHLVLARMSQKMRAALMQANQVA